MLARERDILIKSLTPDCQSNHRGWLPGPGCEYPRQAWCSSRFNVLSAASPNRHYSLRSFYHTYSSLSKNILSKRESPDATCEYEPSSRWGKWTAASTGGRECDLCLHRDAEATDHEDEWGLRCALLPVIPGCPAFSVREHRWSSSCGWRARGSLTPQWRSV